MHHHCKSAFHGWGGAREREPQGLSAKKKWWPLNPQMTPWPTGHVGWWRGLPHRIYSPNKWVQWLKIYYEPKYIVLELMYQNDTTRKVYRPNGPSIWQIWVSVGDTLLRWTRFKKPIGYYTHTTSTKPLGLPFSPSTNPQIEKLTHARALVGEKLIGFQIPGAISSWYERMQSFSSF